MGNRTITLLKDSNGKICAVDTHNNKSVDVMWKPWTSYRLNNFQKERLKKLGFEVMEDATAEDYENTTWRNNLPVPFSTIKL